MIKKLSDIKKAKRPSDGDVRRSKQAGKVAVKSEVESRTRFRTERSFETSRDLMVGAAREMRNQAKKRGKKSVAFIIKNERGNVVARTPFARSNLTLSETLIARVVRKYKFKQANYSLYIIEE